MSREEDEVGESMDNTLEITLDNVKKRATKGIAVLTGRTFFLRMISFVTGVLLGVFLEVEEFGVFFIVSAVVNFLTYFSDVGLGAALIQNKKKITETDLRTTFTVQQVLVILLLFVLYKSTPFLASYYGLSQDGVFLIYALGASFLMSSLKTIPSILLERELDFVKLTIPQIIEQIVYQIVVIVLAWKGFGVMSFAYAVLSRGIVGLVGIYIVRPWIPGLALSKKSLSKLFKFGIPYQINTFLATMKDDGLTAFLGGILGAAGLGYLAWAQKWAKEPLRLFMDNVLKVMFPAFSRMQDDKKHLEHSVTKSIFLVCFLVFPSLVGFLLLAPMMIEIIPRYEKWRPALVPLYIIGIDTMFAASTTQLTNLLNAIGKIKVTFKLMIMWTALAWILIPYLAINYGLNGAAVGYALVSSSSVIPIYIVRKYVSFSIKDGILKPLFATFVMGSILLLVRPFFSTSILSVVALSTIGGIVYMGVSYRLVGTSLIEDVKKAKFNLTNKK